MSVITRIFAMIVILALPVQGMAADVWSRWQGGADGAGATVDHQVWTALLQTYIHQDKTGLNRFRYGAVNKDDRSRIDDYLDGLSATDPLTLGRNEQMAYWINLYNALTVKVILDHYPVESIKDIRSGFLSFHPWDKKWMAVQGEDISLNDIEHRILRPIFQDNRVHYAINCASVGCPNLRATAWTGADIDQGLDQAARAYVNSSRGVWVSDKGKLMVSSIYHWFDEDFGNSESTVLTHIRQFAEDDLRQQLEGRDGYDGHDYDWSLNDRPD